MNIVIQFQDNRFLRVPLVNTAVTLSFCRKEYDADLQLHTTGNTPRVHVKTAQ